MLAPLPWRPLRRALLRTPNVAVDTPELALRFGYARPQDLRRARAEHDGFAAALAERGVEIVWHTGALPGLADAVFTCDGVLPTPGGFIGLRMGKTARRGEPAAALDCIEAMNYPVLGRIVAPGTAEGGDCLWLDERTLAVGEGYRTNPSGMQQLQALLPDIDVLSMPMPHYQGPDACLHLQSVVSFADRDLAVVYFPLAPIRLIKALESRGVHLVALPEAEFETQGGNFICTGPREIVMPAGNPATAASLRSLGVDVCEVPGEELMWLGSGGPTCLTLVLERG